MFVLQLELPHLPLVLGMGLSSHPSQKQNSRLIQQHVLMPRPGK